MKELTRTEAIERLRGALLPLLDDHTSLCRLAAERGIFCRGFSQWSDDQLRERFPWFERFEHGLSRTDLEQRANTWLLHRQHLGSGRLPCDVPVGEGRPVPCWGWDEFYEAELADFVSELSGEEVCVRPDPLPATP